MRSFGRSRLVRGCRGSAIAAALLLALSVPGLRAQSSQPATLYAEAMAREAALRQEMEASRQSTPSEPLLRRMRVMIVSYQDLARLFPTSGYSDNALWQGGMLAADAYRRFGEPVDRGTALSMLKALPARFPTSSLVKQVPAQVARLQETPDRPSAAPATLTSIRREVLPDVLRITLELEREVPFYNERLDAPSRVFVDLHNARAAETLKDVTIPFPDDVVRQIRVGRQIDSRTRWSSI